MAQAKKIKEITLTMPNRVGLLAEVTGAVSGAEANITAICAYAMENRAYFMLTTDNHGKAKKALARLGSEMDEEAVIEVEVPNRPGELEKVAKKIADAGIEIEYMYATARLGKTATCVFKTVDDPKAIKVINK